MLSLERFATTFTSLLERAGEMSWDRCHYYASRYAERGLRFTRSDSAWLAALARRTPDVVVQHVRWLAHVLAERGVPRYWLERHLAVLCNELSSALPEAFTRYAGLLQARDELPTERRAQPAIFALGAELEAAIPHELLAALRDRKTACSGSSCTGRRLNCAEADALCKSLT